MIIVAMLNSEDRVYFLITVQKNQNVTQCSFWKKKSRFSSFVTNILLRVFDKEGDYAYMGTRIKWEI